MLTNQQPNYEQQYNGHFDYFYKLCLFGTPSCFSIPWLGNAQDKESNSVLYAQNKSEEWGELRGKNNVHYENKHDCGKKESFIWPRYL